MTDNKNTLTLKTVTNNYGDFEFENIEKGLTFSLKIKANGYYQINIENITVDKDIYIKEISLQKMI
jgi:predicted  nucleic acid-binding Zn-ribbon protein